MRRSHSCVSLSALAIAILCGTTPALAQIQPQQGPAAINFGNINVCPAGQTTPAPCHLTRKIKYNVTATTTFGDTFVGTQGESDLDFTLVSNTCAGTLPAGSICAVTARFAPRAPGVRMGGVEIWDATGNLLVRTYIFGNGQSPQTTFSPALQKTLPVATATFAALAVDAAGVLFFTDANSGVSKYDPRTGMQTVVNSNVVGSQGLAVDGAGDIFATPCNPSFCGTVEIAAGSGAVTTIGQGLADDWGVAVDGRGNLFIVNQAPLNQSLYPSLVEIQAANGRQHVLAGGQLFGLGIPLLNNPIGVAVDATGNVFVALFNYGPVFELTPNSQQLFVTATGSPVAVALDAAGDLYVNDYNPVYEFFPSGGYTQGNTLYSNPGLIWDIKTDSSANLFMIVGNTIVKLENSRPADLDFGRIAVGSVSAPQSIVIQNTGNQPLNAIGAGITVSAGYQQVPGSGTPVDCTPTFSLAPGASCNLSIVFAPQAPGRNYGKANFIDNAMNRLPSATQSVRLNGNGVQ